MFRHMDLIGEAGTTLPMHAHDWGQLLLVAEGAVSLGTGSGQWLIAPSRSVWVPLRVQHRLAIHRRATLRFLYLSPCVAQRIQDPACLSHPLERLIADSGASRRTIERLLAEETGISLARWRQRWRMNVAAAQLLTGLRVGAVAPNFDYGSVSSFSAAFREQHGTTPAKFGR